MKIKNLFLPVLLSAACVVTIASNVTTASNKVNHSVTASTDTLKNLKVNPEDVVVDSEVGYDSTVVDSAKTDTAVAGTPAVPFAARYNITASSEDNNCTMDIDLFKKLPRKTHLTAAEETTTDCYGVIFIGNAPGYQPDYATITDAQVDGNHANITFISSRDSGTYTAELVYDPDFGSITVQNARLVKVAWSPVPQTMVKNGMTFNFESDN